MSNHVKVELANPVTPTAGDILFMNCNITVPDRLVDSPSGILLAYDEGGNRLVVDQNNDTSESNVTRSNNIFSKQFTINPVKTSDARQYYCIAQFKTLGVIGYGSRNIAVYSKYYRQIGLMFPLFYSSSNTHIEYYSKHI